MIHVKSMLLAPSQVAESRMPHKYTFGCSRASRTVNDVCRTVWLAWGNGILHGVGQGIAKGVFIQTKSDVGMGCYILPADWWQVCAYGDECFS